jgi:Domain of unknown function (DUF4397)
MTPRWVTPPAAMAAKTARIRRSLRAGVLLTGLLGLLLPTLALTAGPAAAASKGDVYVIQGLVGQTPDIYVDGKRVLAKAAAKTIVGPLRLDAGSHEVKLRAAGKTVADSKFRVGAGQSLDVVAHLRSDSVMKATITAFRNDTAKVSPGKLRLTVAHVAAAPPADIKVDGDTLFSNVAAGEALTVVVPARTYTVEIVPAATAGQPILGPVKLKLKKGTLTRVFAIGSVSTGTMDAVVHTLPVKVSGASAPRSVPTGDGGQAASQFTGARSRLADALMASGFGLLLAAGGGALLARRLRRPKTAGSAGVAPEHPKPYARQY